MNEPFNIIAIFIMTVIIIAVMQGLTSRTIRKFPDAFRDTLHF